VVSFIKVCQSSYPPSFLNLKSYRFLSESMSEVHYLIKGTWSKLSGEQNIRGANEKELKGT